jgi:hypothetical protein
MKHSFGDIVDEDIIVGRCCACGERKQLRNLTMLPVKAPTVGRGWGCVVCGLSMDGAVAVVCDECAEIDAEILYACDGYAKDEGRIPIGDLTEPHRHDETKHPEADFAAEVDDDTNLLEFPTPAAPMSFDGRWHWYTQYVDPADDRCSACRSVIPEDEVPLSLFKEVGAETWQARFCEACMPAIFAQLQIAKTDA